MNGITEQDIHEVTDAAHYRPAVSVIMPLKIQRNLKTELTHSLKIAADKVERELKNNYPPEKTALVMQKLRALIKNLDFNTQKKSIAIYVSPVFEKLLYLDIPVEEKIIVDESFEIRDLVYSRKEAQQYLVLILSGKESRIYLGDPSGFERVISSIPESVYAYINEAPERTGNFSDINDRKETVTDKFMHHIDNAVDTVQNMYHLPLFVLGTDKILGHFKNITRHKKAIAGYIHGNYEKTTLPELATVLGPYVADWKEVKQKNLLNQLEEAAGKKKLAFGMTDVWSEAVNHKGRLLLVEKNYMFAAEHGSLKDVIYKADRKYNKFLLIKDAVDDVIEKVLEGGGDVEFVDNDGRTYATVSLKSSQLLVLHYQPT